MLGTPPRRAVGVVALIALVWTLLALPSSGGGHPTLPARIAPYSWFRTPATLGSGGPLLLAYANGYGVEFGDVPVTVGLGADGRSYRHVSSGSFANLSGYAEMGRVLALSPDGDRDDPLLEVLGWRDDDTLLVTWVRPDVELGRGVRHIGAATAAGTEVLASFADDEGNFASYQLTLARDLARGVRIEQVGSADGGFGWPYRAVIGVVAVATALAWARRREAAALD